MVENWYAMEWNAIKKVIRHHAVRDYMYKIQNFIWWHCDKLNGWTLITHSAHNNVLVRVFFCRINNLEWAEYTCHQWAVTNLLKLMMTCWNMWFHSVPRYTSHMSGPYQLLKTMKSSQYNGFISNYKQWSTCWAWAYLC